MEVEQSALVRNTGYYTLNVLENEGTLGVSNTTLSSNVIRDGEVRAVHNVNGSAVLTHVTIANNTKETDPGFANLPGQGLGLSVTGGSVVMARSVLAGHDKNCSRPYIFLVAPATTLNVSDDGTCWSGHSLRVSNNLNVADAKLGPLQDNGGFTETHALLLGSPAINLGGSVGGLSIDQRGYGRPYGLGYDSGAYELHVFKLPCRIFCR